MPKEKDPNEVYELLGIESEESGSQLLAECPFCGKNKFYIDIKKTTYNCKECDSKGNAT